MRTPASLAPRHSLRSRFDLLINLSRADLRTRFRDTYLGLLWSALNPAFTALVLFVVFGRVVRLGIGSYPLFVFVALVPWAFFSSGITHASAAMARSRGLVRQLRIPRALLPAAAVVASLPPLGFGLALVAALALCYGLSLGWWLAWLPIAVALQTALVLGMGLFLACAATRFRDVEHLLAMALRAGFFVTPIIYPLSQVPAPWRTLYLLNPMAGVLEIYRAPLLDGRPPAADALGLAAAMTLVFVLAGYHLFRRLEPDLDDHL